MKKYGLFFGGVLTGIVLTFLVLIVVAEVGSHGDLIDGVTNFEQVGDVIDETSVKVLQVVGANAALVNGQGIHGINGGQPDWYFGQVYFGQVYLLRNYDGKYYYDDEIVECPSGKQFRQTGIYQYDSKAGYKTVPIIELK